MTEYNISLSKTERQALAAPVPATMCTKQTSSNKTTVIPSALVSTTSEAATAAFQSPSADRGAEQLACRWTDCGEKPPTAKALYVCKTVNCVS